MASKILVNYPGSLSNDGVQSKRQSIADALGVCCEDVILLPGVSVSVVDLPDDMTKAREKADKEAEAEAEKAAEEQQAAEIEAIRVATEKQQAEAAANNPAPTASTAVDYESWTVADLHAEAAKREIEGRSGLDKAGLVKALHKADKKKA